MAPNITGSPTGVLCEDDIVETVAVPTVEPKINESKPPQKYRRQIVWRNVILFIYLHVAAVYGAYNDPVKGRNIVVKAKYIYTW
jgi:stearoyl-CoA desaturase (delta-9 desaturase)